MRVGFACIALALGAALCAQPALAQESTAVVTDSSYLRIEYSRYFAHRREIVDSAELAQATRSRRLEVRGRVDEITPGHVVLRAHDRVFTVPRWSIDRAWLFAPEEDALHPVDDIANWGLGGFLAGIAIGGVLTLSCGGWNEDYCGLNLLFGLVLGAGIGIINGLLVAADDVDEDWVEVEL